MDKSAEVILPGVNYFQVVVTLRDTNEVGVSATASQLEGRLLLTGGRSRPTMTSRTYHQPTGRASGIKLHHFTIRPLVLRVPAVRVRALSNGVVKLRPHDCVNGADRNRGIVGDESRF